jgi:hypothetical protein
VDVSWPVNKTEDSCACHHGGEDGFVDLVLEFDLNEVMVSLAPVLSEKQERESSQATRSRLPQEPEQDVVIEPDRPSPRNVVLHATGKLQDGTTIDGYDCVQILNEAGVYPTPVADSVHKLNLFGNYPNPFNPTTTISFYLPEAARVRIEIFNILGQRVATLVDGNMEVGDHKVVWDGSGAATGMYLYRFESAGHVESGKMLLLK